MFTLSLTKLRELAAPELVSFTNDMGRIFNAIGSLPSKIVDCVETFITASVELKEVSVNGKGKASTKKVKFLDTQRVRVLNAIKILLKSLEISSDTTLAEQATTLSSHLTQHKKRIGKSSYKYNTTMINKVLEEWTTDPKLAEACKSIFLRNELEELSKWNKEFEEHYFENAQTNSRKKNLPVKKENVIQAFGKLQKMTESYYTVSDDTTMYEEIYQKSEKLIEKYFIPVAIRKGQKKSKAEVAAATTAVAENNTGNSAAVKDSEE